MIGIAISPEQLAAAPPEVRHWIEKEMAMTLGAVTRAGHDVGQLEASGLAACSAEDVARMFELIKGDYVACEVFFALGCAPGGVTAGQSLYALRLSDILRHTRLSNSARLLGCCDAINSAFRTARQDGQATMLGFDQVGHIFVHALTHQNIRALWEQLNAPQPSAPAREETAAAAAPAP